MISEFTKPKWPETLFEKLSRVRDLRNWQIHARASFAFYPQHRVIDQLFRVSQWRSSTGNTSEGCCKQNVLDGFAPRS
jgi:hypothetical protein